MKGMVCLVAAICAAACNSQALPSPFDLSAPDASADLGAPRDFAKAVDLTPIADCTGLSEPERDMVWQIQSGGLQRTFHVHVPASYRPTLKNPLVLNFHGVGSDADTQVWRSGMIAKSDQAGFIAVHPEGIGSFQSWNAGACCGEAMIDKTNDVQFVADLLDAVEEKLCVDARRVFATGFSNGAFMTHRLACDLSERVAAIAPVSGVMGILNCVPERPIPVLEFHGTADPIVPYKGSSILKFPSAFSTISGWSERDHCDAKSVEFFRQGAAHCEQFANCMAGADVMLCTLDGAGHSWPGGPQESIYLGSTNRDIAATDVIWAFFQQHPMR